MLTTRHLIPRRQLSAIMFVDMVGYSALMQGDEDRAYQARSRYRTALKGATRRCHGEVVHHYGDGALVLFRSAVEASRAALQIQQELRSSPRVMVRIGVHLADVVRDAEGAYGSGINVAARVESLAVPGAVLISDRVAREIGNHPELPSRRLGEFELKNIDVPVGIHALDHEDLVVPDVTALRIQPLPPKPQPEATETGPARICGVQGVLYELHRRRVDQVAVSYVVLAIAAITVLQLVGPDLGLPAGSLRTTLMAAVLGLPVAVRLAWVFDVTPTGIRRTGSMVCVPRRWARTAHAALFGFSLLAAAGLSQNQALSTPRAWSATGDTASTVDAHVDPEAGPKSYERVRELERPGQVGEGRAPAGSTTAGSQPAFLPPSDLAGLRGA